MNCNFLTMEQKIDSFLDPAVKKLLFVLPGDIREKLVTGFLKGNDQVDAVKQYFQEHSEISRLVKENNTSGYTFEYLYLNRKPAGVIDNYFLKSRAGHQIYKRLVAIEEKLPDLIRKMYLEKDGMVVIDNIASGPGNDMIDVLGQNPELVDLVHVRNIDCDQSILDIGREKACRLGISHAFEFCCSKVIETRPRNADIVLLIGVLCPKDLETSRNILGFMKSFSCPGGMIIYSTAQWAMGLGDPMTDYIMRLTGWNMSYKTDEESFDLARQAGLIPDRESSFHDNKRYHCMVVACVP